MTDEEFAEFYHGVDMATPPVSEPLPHGKYSEGRRTRLFSREGVVYDGTSNRKEDASHPYPNRNPRKRRMPEKIAAKILP